MSTSMTGYRLQPGEKLLEAIARIEDQDAREPVAPSDLERVNVVGWADKVTPSSMS